MSKASALLLERVNNGWVPTTGDLVREGWNWRSKPYVVVRHKEAPGGERIELYSWDGRNSRWSFWGHITEGELTNDYKFVGVHMEPFNIVGYGPKSGRSYILWKLAAGVGLSAGCRWFTTYAQAANHWSERRSAKHLCENASEKRAIAKEAFASARRRGWMKVKRQPPVKKARAKK